MAIEASKLERFARQLREGKWETFNIEESIHPKGRGSGQEKATILIRASRPQAYGTGLDITLDEEPAQPAHQGEKRPYKPPTLRVLDPHEVIRKLNAALDDPTR